MCWQLLAGDESNKTLRKATPEPDLSMISLLGVVLEVCRRGDEAGRVVRACALCDWPCWLGHTGRAGATVRARGPCAAVDKKGACSGCRGSFRQRWTACMFCHGIRGLAGSALVDRRRSTRISPEPVVCARGRGTHTIRTRVPCAHLHLGIFVTKKSKCFSLQRAADDLKKAASGPACPSLILHLQHIAYLREIPERGDCNLSLPALKRGSRALLE